MRVLAAAAGAAIFGPPAISTLVAAVDGWLPASPLWLKLRSLWIPYTPDRARDAESRLLSTLSGKWKVEDVQLRDGRTMHALECERLSFDEVSDGGRPIAGDAAVALAAEGDDEVPVVMLHGYASALGSWFAAGDWPVLRSKYRVYALDWPGWGRSSRHRWEIETVEEAEDYFVEALEEWRQQKGIERMRLVGHSLGGYLSAVYALRYPDRVEKLVLVSPAAVPPAKPVKLPASGGMRTLARALLSLWDSGYTPQSMIRGLGPAGQWLAALYVDKRGEFSSPMLQKAAFTDYMAQMTMAPSTADECLPCLLAPFAQAKQPLAHRLHQLQMPVSFLYGGRDWMDWTAADALRDVVPTDVRVYTVGRAGHYVWMEDMVEFEAKLLLAMEDSDLAPHLQARAAPAAATADMLRAAVAAGSA
eukprot:PLAT8513.1.p2 GENE.PLAT8513.1~~PLAT8513.1.p2  ORF type:complete len:432 (-),score=191.40 PLAT8513.1:79-1332(-)